MKTILVNSAGVHSITGSAAPELLQQAAKNILLSSL